MSLTVNNLSYKILNTVKVPTITNISNIDGNNYTNQIHNKTGTKYSGVSGEWDLTAMDIYSDAAGTNLITHYNWSHAQPQNGALVGDYYYTWIGAGSSTAVQNGYVKIAGITIPFNNNFNRIIKWHTTINGSFEYIGQVILIGFSHANFTIKDNNFYISGVNKYEIDSNNALNGYKDIRVFKIPLDTFTFDKTISDSDVYIVPVIKDVFGDGYRGSVISRDSMFARSPDFDDDGEPTNSSSNHYQWLYLPADNNRMYTSNGQNLMMYGVDNTNMKWVSKLYNQSHSLGLNNGGMLYSTDKNRITSHETSDRSMTALNAWYTYTGGRYIQTMHVVGNHLYLLYGGASLAFTASNYKLLKILDLTTGQLLAEFNLNDYVDKYGLPSNWTIKHSTDSEGVKYGYLTDGTKTYFQEPEDLFVTADEKSIIICFVLDTPRYIKFDITWGNLSN